MTKIRVYELAQKMGIDNKELMARLQAVGMDVKSHTASIEESEAKILLAAATPPDATVPYMSRKFPRKKSG